DLILAGKLRLTGDMAVEGPDGGWRGDSEGIVVRDASNVDRIVIGKIDGRSWGGAQLPAGTYGLWGDRSGLYLNGYPRIIKAGIAFDNDVLLSSHTVPAGKRLVALVWPIETEKWLYNGSSPVSREGFYTGFVTYTSETQTSGGSLFDLELISLMRADGTIGYSVYLPAGSYTNI